MRISASWFGSLGSTEYKDVARLIRATESGLPSDRHPDRIECAAVLRAVKVWPGKGRGRGKVGATANLDSSCARRLCNTAGRGEETGFQIEQRNRSRKQEREIAALKPLDNEKPIQGADLKPPQAAVVKRYYGLGGETVLASSLRSTIIDGSFICRNPTTTAKSAAPPLCRMALS